MKFRHTPQLLSRYRSSIGSDQESRSVDESNVAVGALGRRRAILGWTSHSAHPVLGYAAPARQQLRRARAAGIAAGAALVEVIRGLQTDDATVEALGALAKRLGKTPIVVRSRGFVVNRLLCPMHNKAVFLYAEGIVTAQEIDDGMKLGYNHPIGPLALADLIGLDVVLAVMDVFYRNFNYPKYRPAPLLKEMVAAGYLGRKTGRGFYPYG